MPCAENDSTAATDRPDPPWPPRAGEPLPHAARVYAAPEKWDGWILAARGHGDDWARAFRVDKTDAEAVWRAIATATFSARISSVRTLAVGVSCEVRTVLTIAGRTALVRSIWHYADAQSAPRLVTAFPTT